MLCKKPCNRIHRSDRITSQVSILTEINNSRNTIGDMHISEFGKLYVSQVSNMLSETCCSLILSMTHVYVYMDMCAYICIYIYVYVYICIYMYRHRKPKIANTYLHKAEGHPARYLAAKQNLLNSYL